MSFRSRFPVRFADVDVAGIVYYPRLPHFFHIAMEEVIGATVGIPYAELITERKVGLPAVRLEADFKIPLAYGDTVEAEARVLALGNTSVIWRFRLFKGVGGELAVEGRVVTVWMDLAAYRKEPLPDWLRQGLEQLVV